MSELVLEELTLDGSLDDRLGGASLTTAASKIALLGDWSALFHYLLGKDVFRSGRATVDGQDLRQSVIRGETSIVHPELVPPQRGTVDGWLSDQLRLVGRSASQAKKLTDRVLSELELGFLVGRRLDTLNPIDAFAAQLAGAAATQPKTIVIAELPSVPEAAAYERQLVERCTKHGTVLVGCDPFDQMALFVSCDEAWTRDSNGLVETSSPIETFPPGRSYRLTVLRNANALESLFRNTGVVIHTRDNCALSVSVPAGQDVRDLLARAAEASAPVTRMLPFTP